jgi:hypothetical protein
MQVQRISNYQTNYNNRKNAEPAFGLTIIQGENLQKAISKSPAKAAINEGLAAIEKQFAHKPGIYDFEMLSNGALSIKSEKLDTMSGITDPSLAKPGELLSEMRRIIRIA